MRIASRERKWLQMMAGSHCAVWWRPQAPLSVHRRSFARYPCPDVCILHWIWVRPSQARALHVMNCLQRICKLDSQIIWHGATVHNSLQESRPRDTCGLNPRNHDCHQDGSMWRHSG